MTRERAKSEIMQIYGALSPDKQKAIDTLVKIEPCEDCVSRQAVLDTLMKCEIPCDDIQDFYLDSTTEFEEEIKKLPPVKPQPKTGHWIKIDYWLGSWKVQCSECGQIIVVGDEVAKNYCPTCGARMFEPEEGEEV